MTPGYRLTQRAREGLLRIAIHVEAHFGPEVADRVVDDIQKGFDLVAGNPGVGHRREDLTQDERIRFWTVGPTLFAYRGSAHQIEVLFVERADLDWYRVLERAGE